MNQVESALRALRVGPLNWSRVGWAEAKSFVHLPKTYGKSVIDELVRLGFAKTVFRRKGRNRRIVSGTVEIRPFGALHLKHIEGGFHINIGQGDVRIENRQRVDRKNGRFCAAAVRESAGA